MADFFKHAWRNPRTTFGLTGAILTLLAVDLADGTPMSVVKACHIGAGVMGIFVACVASDAATAAAGDAAK